MTAHSFLRSLATLTLLTMVPVGAMAQESVQAAATLYASASYDEALALLDRLQRQQLTPSEIREVNQQRAFCLLALGRTQDAEQAITAVVEVDPTYRPEGASPRVRNAFRDVRARLLPSIVQAEYAESRKLYDGKSWAEAAARFQRVVALASDADLAETQRAALTDLRILADGFAKLAEAAATPPAPEPVAATPAEPPPPAVDYDAVYESGAPGVVAPVTLRQVLPRWTNGQAPPRASGMLEIIITKTGVVERATLTQPIAQFFDRQVLDATKNWKYEPAQLDGQPVRFRKTIKITFQ